MDPAAKSDIHSCCHAEETENAHRPARRVDWLLWGSATVLAILYGIGLWLDAPWMWLHTASHTAVEMVHAIWWGVLLGMLFVGALGRVPKEHVVALLGPGDRMSGILRAATAGVLFDLCSHGILMVAMKLYERGASVAQVMAFLIASPWNSLSLTLILFGLIGVTWTLLLIGLSIVVAILSGWAFQMLTRRGVLPGNPNQVALPDGYAFWDQARDELRTADWSPSALAGLLHEGVLGSRMVLRWILFGIVLAAAVRAAIPVDHFQDWFGPTALGLGLTILFATLIEVCSEGSVPLAADLFNRAGAPGNAFAFLMGGVATDYTEILSLKDTTGSWKIALFLPLISVPQIILIAWLLNA